MAVRITERLVWDAKCDQCGQTRSTNTQAKAASWQQEHQNWHVSAQLAAPRLTGKVYDSRKSPTWLGHIGRAVEAATEAGFPYLEWNEQVYVTADVDLNNPVCRAVDVPGLRSPC